MSASTIAAAVSAIVIVVGGLSATTYLYFGRKGPALTAKYKLFGMSPPPKAETKGFTAARYERLRLLLQKGFEDGDDLGSQFAAYVDGNLVADISCGFTDNSYKTEYTSNNLQLVFSSSKFVTSCVFLHLVNTNRIALDDPIVKYWPEFGAGGKAHVTVGMLLHHRAGVAFLDPDRVPTPEKLLNLDELAEKIAGQPHNFGGRNVSAYHAVTRGWFLNEIARRATGKTIRDIMYDEIMPLLNKDIPAQTQPFELNYGIPDEPKSRALHIKEQLVKLSGLNFIQKLFYIFTPRSLMKRMGLYCVPQNVIDALLKPDSPANKGLFKSGPDFTGREAEFPWSYNDETLLRSQSPSFACITNARSLAYLAEFVRRSNNSDTEGLVSKATLAEGLTGMGKMKDEVVYKEIEFVKIGFAELTEGFGAEGYGEFIAKDVCFYGWAGAGGSLVLFSPEYGISLAYTMNFCQVQAIGDVRSWRLIDELVKVVKSMKESAQ
ncbi:hypothetical protein HDU83_006876 [Entophlyctis luteolus]|nr:hypothetical protein HDU83_006876 [Entophlyctis luteolus]